MTPFLCNFTVNRTFFCPTPWSLNNECFRKRAACTCEDDIQAQTKHFQSMSAPNISNSTYQTEESQSAWSNQSANHPTSFIQSKRRTVICGDFTRQDAKWTWTESHDSCVIGVSCLPIASKGCVIWARAIETNHGSVPGHLYDSWQPWHPEINPTRSSS